jgi:hypothetical protein
MFRASSYNNLTIANRKRRVLVLQRLTVFSRRIYRGILARYDAANLF